MTEIKPCPFCRSTDMVESPIDNFSWVVYCNQCEYQSPVEMFLNSAIAAHNFVSDAVHNPKIKPCPFCGSHFVQDNDTPSGNHYIVCLNCRATGSVRLSYRGTEQHIVEWNAVSDAVALARRAEEMLS